MKTDHWIIVIVLLLLTALGGMMGLNTIIGEQQEALIAAQTEQDRLTAIDYWTRISRLPRPYSLPLEQIRVSSGCGYRMDPMGGGTEGLHKGVDLVGPEGTPVYAVMPGVIVEHWVPPDGKRWKGHPVMGGYLVLDHGNGLFTEFGHLDQTFVHEGDYVETGQVIGLLGSTGMSTGLHLHFAVVVDPLIYFFGEEVP